MTPAAESLADALNAHMEFTGRDPLDIDELLAVKKMTESYADNGYLHFSYKQLVYPLGLEDLENRDTHVETVVAVGREGEKQVHEGVRFKRYDSRLILGNVSMVIADMEATATSTVIFFRAGDGRLTMAATEALPDAVVYELWPAFDLEQFGGDCQVVNTAANKQARGEFVDLARVLYTKHLTASEKSPKSLKLSKVGAALVAREAGFPNLNQPRTVQVLDGLDLVSTFTLVPAAKQVGMSGAWDMLNSLDICPAQYIVFYVDKHGALRVGKSLDYLAPTHVVEEEDDEDEEEL